MKNNFSSRVQMVIQFSREEAMRLGHDYIGTEHLLLGLLREGEGIAAEILKNIGLYFSKLDRSCHPKLQLHLVLNTQDYN